MSVKKKKEIMLISENNNDIHASLYRLEAEISGLANVVGKMVEEFHRMVKIFQKLMVPPKQVDKSNNNEAKRIYL